MQSGVHVVSNGRRADDMDRAADVVVCGFIVISLSIYGEHARAEHDYEYLHPNGVVVSATKAKEQRTTPTPGTTTIKRQKT